ncbi:MAG: hypothetical protein AAFX41_03350 [Bacteroidota bacterium]
MGRGLLIAALASSLFIAFGSSSTIRTILSVSGEQAAFGNDVTAREIARSGYDVAYRTAELSDGTLDGIVSAVNGIRADRPFQGGVWNAEAFRIDAETALIRVSGTVGDETHTTEGLFDLTSVFGPSSPPMPVPEALARTWEFECADNRFVDLYTVGIGTYGRTNNDATIDIPNASNVLGLTAQATVKGAHHGRFEHFVFTTDAGERVVIEDPTSDDDSGDFYTTALDPAGSVTIEPIVKQTGWSGHARSFAVYALRFKEGYAQSGGIVERDVWVGRTKEVTVDLPIPAGTAPRNVTVTFSLGDTTNDGRLLSMEARAGSVYKSFETPDANRGAQAALFELVLEDVPGTVTTVEATVYSRNGTHDSIFYNGVTATVPCS